MKSISNVSNAQSESTSLFMAAIDGGYCTLKRDDKLTIDFASSKALKLTGEESSVLHLTDYMTEEDRREFFKAFRPHGTFSVKCNLIIDNKLVPTTLKCNTSGDLIYCDITIQADWFKYAARVLQDKLDYERLVNYSNTYLFAMDLRWNFINYTANFKELFGLKENDRNLKQVLGDNARVHPECEQELGNIFSLNAMYQNDVVEYLKVKNRKTGAWDMFRIELRVIYNQKGNYAEFAVGSFVDVKDELAQASAGSSYRDRETGAFYQNFLETSKYMNVVTGRTVAAYVRLETSVDMCAAFGYNEGSKFFKDVFKKIVKACDADNALVVRTSDRECFIVQPDSDKAKMKQCLLRVNSLLKSATAECKARGCITSGVVGRENNMAPVEQLLDDAYEAYRGAKKKGIGSVVFNVT